MERSRREKVYVFPAQNSLATAAVDVRDRVQAGNKIPVLLGTQCDVDSAHRQFVQTRAHFQPCKRCGPGVPLRRALHVVMLRGLGSLGQQAATSGASRSTTDQEDLHIAEEERPAVPALEGLHTTVRVSSRTPFRAKP